MIGHNRGPTIEKGAAWRRHCWTRARRDLLPRMPLEVVRIRMRRARELGLAFATYNKVRTTTGRDIIAFLFSTNALRVMRLTDEIPADRGAKMAATRRCTRLFAAQPPFRPGDLQMRLAAARVEHGSIIAAPSLGASWSDMRDQLQAALRPGAIPPDAVLVIGETALEREWPTAARMAGFLPADDYFASSDQP